MTAAKEPVTVLFEAEFAVRTGPSLSDYRVMQGGETIEVDDDLRARNRSGGLCLFDLDPDFQSREFGRVLVRVIEPGQVSTYSDPRASDWYRPLGAPPRAEPASAIPTTSFELVRYRTAR